MMRDQRAREVRMRRMMGVSREHAADVSRELAGKDDWRGTCKGCGAELQGTIDDLRDHRCGEVSSDRA